MGLVVNGGKRWLSLVSLVANGGDVSSFGMQK
jgi:hypothetical protein